MWKGRDPRPRRKVSLMLNIEEFYKNGGLFDGHYLLVRPLSVDGATADVWLALDTNTVCEADKDKLEGILRLSDDDIGRIGLVVAIKIYRPQNALDIEGEQRFRDEYMIVFNCHHTNLIHPTQFSIFKETPYLVLPYCKLGSSELLIGSTLSNDCIWKYILDVASGLAYLHAMNPPIVHQDIKPANILLDDTYHYAITDFGISSQKGGVHGSYGEDKQSGTCAYMAPERFQFEAEPIPQSDIWAFGATLFEILTGRVPFGEEGGEAQMEADSTAPEIRGVQSDIQRLISACLAKEPQNRPSAEQIVAAAKVRQYPIRSKRFSYLIVGILAAVILGLIILMFPRNKKNENPNVPKAEDVYQVAYSRMNSNNLDTLKLGMKQMDSLSNANYIPAIYQMAFTYGWYSDSASVNRKKLLGIEMDEASYLPKSDKYSNKAVELFTKIMELGDSAYSDINANATYRLACYYVTRNNIYKPNYAKGKSLLMCSRKWAQMSGNKELVNKIDKGLATFSVQNK